MTGDNTISLLSTISTNLATIVKNMQPQNEKAVAKDSVSKLNGGGLNVTEVASPKEEKISNVGSIASVAVAIKALSDISPIIKDIAGISGRNVGKFEKTMHSVILVIEELVDANKDSKEATESAKMIVGTLKDLSSAVTNLALVAPLAPIALLSMTLLSPTILLYGALMDRLGRYDHIDKGTDSLKGLRGFGREMLMFSLSAVLTLTAAIAVGTIIKNHQELITDGLIGLAAITGVMIVMIGVAWLAQKIIEETVPAKTFLEMALVMTTAATLVLVSGVAGKYVKTHLDDVLTGIGGITAVVLAISGLVKLSEKIMGSNAAVGIGSIIMMEMVMLAAMGIVYLAANMSEKMDGKWKGALAVIGLSSGILVAIGGLAVAAGALSEFLIPGVIALGGVMLVANGMIRVLDKIVDFHNRKKELAITWGDLEIDTLGMGGVLGTFSGVCAILTPLAAITALAMPGFFAVEKLAIGMVDVIDKFMYIREKLSKAGGTAELIRFINEDVHKLMGSFNLTNFDLGMKPSEIRQLRRQYKNIGKLVDDFADAAFLLSTIANIGGIVVDENTLRPISSYKGGVYEFDDTKRVDIKMVGEAIANTISIFTTTLDDNLEGNVGKASRFIRKIGRIIDPVSSFVSMVSSMSSEDGTTLKTIKVDDAGNIVYGPSVNVVKVSDAIASAISQFVGTLFNEENSKKWQSVIDGTDAGGRANARRARRGLKKSMGILGDIIEPITAFVDFVSDFKVIDGKLRKITYDSEGRAVVSDTDIDIKSAGEKISEGIGAFISGVYNQESIKRWKSVSKSGRDDLNDAIEPITSFADAIINLSGDPATSSNGVIERLAISINNARLEITNFDELIADSDKKRDAGLKNFAASVGVLSDKLRAMNEPLKNFNNLMETLGDADSNSISRNVSALNGINIKTGDATGGYRMPTISKEDIIDAVRVALDGIEFTPIEKGVTTSNRSEDILKAILKTLSSTHEVNIADAKSR